jgi:hypothetical protein
MDNENTAYEKYVRGITEALLRAQGLRTVEVKHDVAVRGTSRSHQIDVYWEYRLGGVVHRVVINCKRYKHTVEVTDVLTLAGVLADLPGVRGLIVSTVGFQRGAIDYARQHQIGLKVIRPPEDSDWEGRIRSFRIDMRLHVPVLTECFVDLDKAAAAAAAAADGDAGLAPGPRTFDAATTMVRDLKTGTVSDLNELYNRAIRENPSEPGEAAAGTLRWEDAVLET